MFPTQFLHLENGILHRGDDWYCGHPRQVLFKQFPDGELVVGHNHAPCVYSSPDDVRHDLHGYHSRAIALLQRSDDEGQTWPSSEEVAVYDETRSTEEKRTFLYQPDAPRADFDMFHPDSLFFFGRTYLPEERGKTAVCLSLRSADRGHSWETVPTLIEHPDGSDLWVHKDCHPVIRMPDGRTLLAGMSLGQTTGGGPAVYASTDHGLTWNFQTRVPVPDEGRSTYVGLLLLPSGELHCFFLNISGTDDVHGTTNAICLSTSSDGGHTWALPRPIVGEDDSWPEPRGAGKRYRSPWPILLRDGRILVLFARRRMPMGIGATLSADGGQTWGQEFPIRADADHRDLGYPVGCQLDDGRIFTAYYYNRPSTSPFGGVRFIASSHFELAT